VGFGNFLSHKTNYIFNIDLGFGAMNAVFVGFDNFLSRKTNVVSNVNLGFGEMNAVFVGLGNFLSRKTTAVFNVDLGFPTLRITDVFKTPRSAFQIHSATFYYNINDTKVAFLVTSLVPNDVSTGLPSSTPNKSLCSKSGLKRSTYLCFKS